MLSLEPSNTPYGGEPTALITANTLTDELYFTDAQGRESAPRLPIRPVGFAAIRAEQITTLLTGLGEGWSSIQDAQEVLGKNTNATRKLVQRLTELTPKGILAYAENAARPTEYGEIRGELVCIGKFAVATLIPTEQEKERAESIRTPEGKKLDAEAALLAAEGRKIQLAPFDEAFIQIKDRNFYVDLSHPSSVLFVRLLDVLRNDKGAHFRTSDLATATWQAMTIADRALYASEKEIIAPTPAFKKEVEVVALGFMRHLGITTDYPPKAVDVNWNIDVRILLGHTTEIDTLPEAARATELLPPGVQNEEEDVITQDHKAKNTTMVQGIVEKFLLARATRVTQAEAIEILDAIMDKDRKIILEILLRGQGAIDYTEALNHLHRLCNDTLGSHTYAVARSARTIADRKIRGVQQVGGRLPSSTMKWRFGKGGRRIINPNDYIPHQPPQ